MSINRVIITIISILFFLSSCNKDIIVPGKVKLSLEFIHSYNNKSILWDTLVYSTCNSDTISISKIEYIVSNIVVYSRGSAYKQKRSFYVNPRQNKTVLQLDSVMGFYYDSLSFTLGDNHPYDSLNTDIVSMQWPMMMGGGFHFLKLEGYYRKNSLPTGYAMHTGGNNLNPIKIVLKYPLHLTKSEHTFVIEHKIDQWFESKQCYKVSDANYSMGVDSLMQIINENGRTCFKPVQLK
ncbi:MAG: hypothetical protein KatS3mg027_1051 [Bacteroidia bacterium]|nr:MAG: hypothetical protein KatS3mg027_1051 [Bacteroidia bacterium]